MEAVIGCGRGRGLGVLCQCGGGRCDRAIDGFEIFAGHAVGWKDVDCVAERAQQNVGVAKRTCSKRAGRRLRQPE
jgi:hypothetical protein